MNYQTLTPELLEQLTAIAPGRVFAGSDINEDYSHDEMPIYGKATPEAVVEANSTEEIAAVMKFCNEHHIPVTPRGAGTGLVGGAVAIRGGVLLVTTRMNKILGYDLENFTVTVQPGVLLNTLAEDASSKGLLYPPDPGEKFATLGGNVSTNAGGMRAVKYGVTRDYVLAMTVVLPSGEVVKLGKAVVRNRTRRRIKEAYRIHEGAFLPGYDIVVVARVRAAHSRYRELERSLLSLADKLGLLRKEGA